MAGGGKSGITRWLPLVVFSLVFLGFLALYGSKLYLGSYTNRININFLVKTFGAQGAFLVHFLIFGVFLLLLQVRSNTDWRSSGIFTAFMISLFGEMFGWSLFIYLFSNRFFQYQSWVSRPGAVLWRETLAARITRPLGAWIVFISLVLIAYSWYHLYQQRGSLVTNGIYSKIRHPQYVGFIGFTLGWLVYWPTMLNFFLWPVLFLAYVSQAYREDNFLSEKYGSSFEAYRTQTGMFFPRFKRGNDKTGGVHVQH